MNLAIEFAVFELSRPNAGWVGISAIEFNWKITDQKNSLGIYFIISLMNKLLKSIDNISLSIGRVFIWWMSLTKKQFLTQQVFDEDLVNPEKNYWYFLLLFLSLKENKTSGYHRDTFLFSTLLKLPVKTSLFYLKTEAKRSLEKLANQKSPEF